MPGQGLQSMYSTLTQLKSDNIHIKKDDFPLIPSEIALHFVINVRERSEVYNNSV